MSLYKQGLWIWAAVLWTLVQLPFTSGPFRIDDPYHLEAAKQMQRAPTDPYGFHINWDGTPKSSFVTYASPPLVPAWLALWSCVFPENEVSLHVAMLAFSIVALVSFGLLARSFSVPPSIAMALLACFGAGSAGCTPTRGSAKVLLACGYSNSSCLVDGVCLDGNRSARVRRRTTSAIPRARGFERRIGEIRRGLQHISICQN